MTFVLPPKEQIGVLDPEIAGEGQQVILSDGEQVSWSPPPVAPVIPDWSKIKSLQKYFGRSGYQVYPAWLYHPTEAARLVKNAQEAAALGVCHRKATIDERGRYGLEHVWDWNDGSAWRPQPYQAAKFDPRNPGIGKTYVPSPPAPEVARNALLAELIPAVAAAVATALNASGGPAAPAGVDAGQWQEFIEFKAWQASQAAVEDVAVRAAAEDDEPQPALALNSLTPEQERVIWEEEARRKGIKVDGRWSMERLKAEIEKAA